MRNPKEFNFAIFGRIIHTDYFIKALHKNGFPMPLVITSPDEEYIRDKRLLIPYGLYGDLESLEKESLAKLYKMETVNSKECLDLLAKHGCNVGISINCRNIIKKSVIDFFNGQIFNIHDSYLPNERGGALNTWRILNNIGMVGDSIHYLEEGIDTGPVIVRRELPINTQYPRPIDYLIAEVDNCKYLIDEFIKILLKNDRVPCTPQENNKSFYFPRLFTEINGCIDWDWDAIFVERFIRGFSTPYPGAFTCYRNKQIHILDAYIDESVSRTFHPLCNGKIVTILDNKNVRVIAGGRALVLTEITVDGESVKPSEFLSVKYTLNSKSDDLTRARCHVPTTREMNENEKISQRENQ